MNKRPVIRAFAYLLIANFLVFKLFGCQSAEKKTETDSPELIEIEQPKAGNDTIVLSSYILLGECFDSLDFKLEDSRTSKKVPDIRVMNIHSSIKSLDVDDKKRAFISSILLATVSVNDEIHQNRDTIAGILQKETSQRTEPEIQLLNTILSECRVKPEQEDQLLEHYDILPISLVIAQAILESAWGTSHFAITGNSLFGEHMSHSAKGKYIQAEGSDIRLRAFNTIEGSVKGYIHNINRNPAYKGLRRSRSAMREKGTHLDGIALASTEDHYSELGHAYTERIITVINYNKLNEYDLCRFPDPKKIVVIKIQ